MRDLVAQQEDYIISMRRAFHSHPEVSGEEFHTREVLIHELENMGVPYQKLPGTGLIAVIQGANPGKNRVLRADIDALPIQEDKNNLKGPKTCVSAEPGVCHACGHDAHMAMLLGTMKVLLQLREHLNGAVYCCFEEGEETNCGIDAMMDALKVYPVDECFALHVYNALDAGKINIVPGARMAGNIGIGIYIHGKAGHGSRPDQAVSPIIPAAHIITQLNSAFMNRLNVEETVTLGLGVVKAGTATNVIPDEAYIGGTSRFFNAEEGERALSLINQIAESTAANFGCAVSCQTHRHKISPKAVINDPGVVERTVTKMWEYGVGSYLSDCERWFASECYSAYLDRYPGALGMLGIRNEALGTGAAHHNEKFDIDESALKLGALAELAFVFGGDGPAVE
ncbi:MAG: amidohydrolase [Clostridiales bacterium]|nr:amidohydrolase [Clostridiales bacterium]